MSVSSATRPPKSCGKKDDRRQSCTPAADLCGFPETIMSRQEMESALCDAGLEASVQKRFFALCEEGRMTEGLSLLKRHRHFLLEAVHTCQKQIDCLDFFLFSLKQGMSIGIAPVPDSPCLFSDRNLHPESSSGRPSTRQGTRSVL